MLTWLTHKAFVKHFSPTKVLYCSAKWFALDQKSKPVGRIEKQEGRRVYIAYFGNADLGDFNRLTDAKFAIEERFKR